MEKEIKKKQKWNWTYFIGGGLIVFWVWDFIIGIFVPNYSPDGEMDARTFLRLIIIIAWTAGYYYQLKNKNE